MGGAEHDVPPRRADTEPTCVVLEMMAHVELVQALAEPAAWAMVMESKMRHVVGEVSPEKPCADRPRKRCPQNQNEEHEKCRRERQRERGRKDEALGIVRVLVVDAVDDPVHACPQTAPGLEVEHSAVEPILDERPEEVAADDAKQDLGDREPAESENREDHDRGAEDQHGDSGVHARDSVDRSRLEERW